MRILHIILLIIGLSFGQNLNANTKPYFIIELVKLKFENSNIEGYAKHLESNAKLFNGKLLVSPIHVVDQIKTEVTPIYTSDFNYDYIIIFRFEDKKSAKHFVTDKHTIQIQRSASNLIKDQTIIISKNMMVLPGMPKFPEIENKLTRREPAFILVNAIKMKKTPGAIIKMMKYFKRNYPMITESGTSYFSTLKVVEVLKGDFDFQMLFLTEWANMDAFQKVHNSSSFKENVYLRNSSFTGFTEGKAKINIK